MKCSILIITGKADAHPTPVINLLNKRNIPFFRLNTEALLTDYEFTWYCDNESEDIVIKNIVNGQVISGKQIKSIWWRRPVTPSELKNNSKLHIDNFNLSEAVGFYDALMYYFSDKYSIGNFRENKYASSKMTQLRIASKLGMKIPSSIMSNTKTGVLRIASNYPEVIIKPLKIGGIIDDNNLRYDFYATKVTSDDLFNLPDETFTQTINFCENYEAKDYEVRVTVIGPYIFACKLDSQILNEDEGRIDWRQGYEHGLRHEMITVPTTIECFCKQFLRIFHLNFGCFDFIVRPDGEYVFLECNPNGQWGWIEDELGITSMREAIVDCLVNCAVV